MRVAVMGSGAVGGYFGAKLAAAGHELAFLARGRHLAALQTAGLTVLSAAGNLQIRQAVFTSDPKAVGKVDLVLFCVKSHDTEIAAQSMAPLVSVNSKILSLQNGIDNPDKLARIYGANQIFPGVVYIGAQLTAPGVITHSTGGKIIFGQLDGKLGDGAKSLSELFVASEVPVEASSDIRKVQWTKLLWNAAFCAISCLTRADTKEIVESASLSTLAVECMNEVRAAARVDNIELAEKLCVDTLAFSKTLGDFKPSMLQDLEGHKPLEYEAFNGFVAKRLEARGQSAPINRVFYDILKFLDERIRKES